MGRIDRCNTRTQPAHTFHDKAKIDRNLSADIYAILGSITHSGRCLGTPQQCFGRHTAHREAVATKQVRFNECHKGADACRSSRRNQTAGSASDHNKVIGRFRFRIDPLFGMQEIQHVRVVLIQWRNPACLQIDLSERGQIRIAIRDFWLDGKAHPFQILYYPEH